MDRISTKKFVFWLENLRKKRFFHAVFSRSFISVKRVFFANLSSQEHAELLSTAGTAFTIAETGSIVFVHA